MLRKFSLTEFLSFKPDELAALYEDTKSITTKIARQLETDLEGFKKQHGHGEVMMHSVRIKDRASTVEKLQNRQKKISSALSELKADKDSKHNDVKWLQSKRLAEGDPSVNINTFVGDLVGARVVFALESDLFTAIEFVGTDPSYISNKIEYYSVFEDESPLAPSEIYKFLSESLPGVQKAASAKASCYESVHIETKYEPQRLQIRTYVREHKETLESAKDEEIGEISFELQLRTVLQHVWSELEHRLVYKRFPGVQGKRTDHLLSSNYFNHRENQVYQFQNLKLTLSAGERILTGIKRNEDQRDREISLLNKSSSISISPVDGTPLRRMRAFAGNNNKRKNDIYKDLDAINKETHGHILPTLYIRFQDLIVRIETVYNTEKLTSIAYSDKEEIWEKRRLILLMCGFILGFHIETKELYGFLNWVRERESCNNILPLKPKYAAIRIYEHIRGEDSRMRFIHEELKAKPANRGDEKLVKKVNFYNDPLPHYRLAGIHQSFGDFGRAIHLLDEVLDRNYIARFCEPGQNKQILTEYHFKRRRAEYLFRDWQKNQKQDLTILNRALEDIISSMTMLLAMPEAQRDRPELRKAFHVFLIISFYHDVLFNPNGPSRDAYKHTIEKVIPAIDEAYLDFDRALKGKGRSMTALALFQYRNSETGSAKQTIKRAIDLMESHRMPFDYINTGHEIALFFEWHLRDQTGATTVV